MFEKLKKLTLIEIMIIVAIIGIVGAAVLSATGCDPRNAPSSKDLAAAKGEQLAEKALGNGNNAEQQNIQKRLKLTSEPGLLGYVVLLNDMGKPVLYSTVDGKLTSGSKRLTKPWAWGSRKGTNGGRLVISEPSDEGTWGSSSPYIYFWDNNGRYHQWSGQYLYSDQPILLNDKPLVINVVDVAAE